MTLQNNPQWVDLLCNGELIHSSLCDLVFDPFGGIVNGTDLKWTLTKDWYGPYQLRTLYGTAELLLSTDFLQKGDDLIIRAGDLTYEFSDKWKKAMS